MQIYLARDNVQAGPYSLDEFNRMLLSGEVVGTDLMWHANMDNWQAVSVRVTQTPYNPNGTVLQTDDIISFGDNVDMRSKRRVSVAELYGKKSQKASTTSYQDKQATPKLSEETADWQGRQKPVAYSNEPATALARFGAVVINGLLFLLSLMPMQLALIKSGLDFDKYRTTDASQIWQNSQALAVQMQATISQTTMGMTTFMLFGLIAIQLLMIMVRGQSLGKFAFGVATVDNKTKKISPIKNLVRTFGLFVIYMLAINLTGGLLAGILLSVNYIMASRQKGWHDRLFGTNIVKTASKDTH